MYPEPALVIVVPSTWPDQSPTISTLDPLIVAEEYLPELSPLASYDITTKLVFDVLNPDGLVNVDLPVEAV